ncbi:MAG: hypothetical protein E7218_01205 [Anaerofustis stercorihominis]|nr:hypothetical protein [Anaerofustis stercorihominis]
MKKTKIKAISLMICLLMVVGVVVGGTVAFLMDASDEVENTFTPSEVTTDVVEDTDSFENEGIKKDVVIKNTGDTDAFIRAAIVVTWQDEQGNVYGQKPVPGTDYEILLNVDTKDKEDDDNNSWILGNDGFYYHKEAVAGNNDATEVLINSCTSKNTEPDSNYKLCVEILGSGIQSVPEEVVENVWGVTVENGVITVGGGNQ